MKHSFSYTVTYQQVDASRRMRLSAFVNDCVLNAAGKAADEGGFGIPDLLPYHYTWIISRLSLCLKYLPTYGQQIRVYTWVEQNAHMLSVRNYEYFLIKQGQEHYLGKAKSVWAVLELNKREIVDAFSLPMFAHAQDGTPLDMPKAPRILPLPEGPLTQHTHTIQYADVDYNGHCNSCRYIEQMLNTVLPECLTTEFRVDINYLRELHAGDILTTKATCVDQTVYFQQLDSSLHTCCSALFTPFFHWGC